MKLFIYEKHHPHLKKDMLLIKLQQGEREGVASLLSWPHLGDPELSELCQDLLNEQKNSLVQKALYFAYHDLYQKNLKPIQLPQSHKLVQDEEQLLQSLSCKKLKLKPKKNVVELAQLLNDLQIKPDSLRIDFNNRLSQEQFKKFVEHCSTSTLEAIEFIEDPFEYNEESWEMLQKKSPKLHLALDHGVFFKKLAFDVYIWKPAKSFYKDLNCKIIPTHYLSDEIEWYCSLWEASQYEGLLNQVCGFGGEHINLTYKPGDVVQIKKHWNHDIQQYPWKLVSEDFSLVFQFSELSS